MRRLVCRFQLDRVLQNRNRLGKLPFLRQRHTEISGGHAVYWIEFDGFFQDRYRHVKLLPADEGISKSRMAGSISRIQLDSFAEGHKGLIGFPFGFERQAEL